MPIPEEDEGPPVGKADTNHVAPVELQERRSFRRCFDSFSIGRLLADLADALAQSIREGGFDGR